MTLRIALVLLLALAVSACQSTKEKQLEAFYGPSESILEVVAVLRRHVPDDTYRFEPATDFTGRNVYRSSLLRLENLERIHARALETGTMRDVIEFAKGRALERLRAYDLAAERYRNVAARGGTLAETAAFSAPVCEGLATAIGLGLDLVDPLSNPDALPLQPDLVITELDERVAALSALLEAYRGTHYAFVIREEIERADLTRARYFVSMRSVFESGQLRAVAELQRVTSRHAASKYRRRHMVGLANFYVTLAQEYVSAVPPSSLEFDPPRFRELVDAASQLYQAVATQDGTAEKLEASRRLEAFLAFALTVDRDRFSH